MEISSWVSWRVLKPIYAFVSGRRFSRGYLLIVSAAVILILVVTLTWDVSRKATCAFLRNHADSQEDVANELVAKLADPINGVSNPDQLGARVRTSEAATTTEDRGPATARIATEGFQSRTTTVSSSASAQHGVTTHK
ncbi:hypothetical protein HKD37_04G009193 [Glycine soja]